MGGIAVLLGLVLAIASIKLQVEEDPRIDEVNDHLPQANCAACGMAGCRNFAEQLVAGNIDLAQCSVMGSAESKIIAGILGLEHVEKVTKVARVFCGGGKKEAKERAEYIGIRDCTAAGFVGGGGKACTYGCLGFGNCAASCPFEAMFMDDNGLPYVVDEKCTACGKCVTACPRNLIELVDCRNQVIIQCKSQDKGAVTRKRCTVGCIACTLCVKNCPHVAIEMKGNLAVMDFAKCQNAEVCIGVCPTKTIVNVTKVNAERSVASRQRTAV